MPAKATAEAKPETPAAVKTAATRKARAPKVVEAPHGKVLKDHPKSEAHEVPVEQRKGERRQSQRNAMEQFVASQMTTPAAHATPELTDEQKKAQAFQEELKKLAEQYGVDPAALLKPAKAARTPRPDKQVQNNITRPATGTACGAIWDLADQISHDQQGHPALISQLRAHASMKQVNENTLKTQYARWRSYHGIKGRAVLVPKSEPEGEQPAPVSTDE